MSDEFGKPKAGERVVLIALPPGLLDGFPDEDRRAIAAIVGQPVDLIGYNLSGKAELHFLDPFSMQTEESIHSHSIWVEPEFITRYRV